MAKFNSSLKPNKYSFMKFNLVFLFLLLLLEVNQLNAQNYDDETRRLEVVKKIRDARINSVLTALSFEDLETVYNWRNSAGSDLTKFGFDLYSKFTQSGKRYGLIKLPKDTITKVSFELVNGAFSGGIVVANNNKVGMVDSSGNLVIPTQYDEIIPFVNDRGFVMKDRKYAAITYSGKFLTPFLFDQVGGFSNNAALVVVNKKLGFIDQNGKYIIQPQFNDATYFFHGFARIYFDKWESAYKAEVYQGLRKTNVDVGYTKSIPFLINKRGQKVFSGRDNDRIYISENSYAVIGRNNYINGDKYYFETVIDTTGRIIVSFDRKLGVSALSKDWIIVRNPFTGYFGVFNFDGKELIKPTFWGVEALQFKEGKLGKVYFDEKIFFYVDKNCNCVEFDNVKCPEKD